MRISGWLVGATLATLATVSGAQTVASSSFDSGSDGWTAKNGAKNFTWLATGGDPGGYIQAEDVDGHGLWFFNPSASYLGDLSSAYGGMLSYDIETQSATSPINGNYAAVQLLGANGVLLAVAAPSLPTSTWTEFSFSLIANGAWKIGSTSGASATAADMQGVLANVQSLRIGGDYYQGVETTGIDSVMLTAAPVPEPSSMALWALGLAGLTGLTLARRRAAP